MNNRVFLLKPPANEYAATIPLPLAYLTSVLRKTGYEVRVMDANMPYKKITDDEIVGAIKEFDPLFVGMTLMYESISQKYQLMRRLRELSYPLIAGGPHVNICPEEVLTYGCNIVAIGEGENTICDLAQAFQHNKPLDSIDGLIFKKSSGEIVFTRKRERIQNLDEIPFPDYSDYEVRDYLGTSDYVENKTYFNVFTSRGCPYRCTYCSASRVWRGGQINRSAQNVFDEIAYLVETFGAQYVAFMDNEPLVDKDRVYALCDLLEKAHLGVKISSRARVDNIDEDMLKRMMDVGFYKMAIGVESGDNETLEKVNRRYTQDDVIKAMSILERIKFPVINFNNLIGFPWETETHLKNTLRMNERIPKKLRYFVNVLTPVPMPGTPLYFDYYKEYGFQEWWLDDSKHDLVIPKDEEKPFHQLFMPILKLDYFHVDFWKYTKKFKKRIFDYQIKIQNLAFQKSGKYSTVELLIVTLFVRLSVLLFCISPRLEKTLLHVFKTKQVLQYAKKYRFKEQG